MGKEGSEIGGAAVAQQPLVDTVSPLESDSSLRGSPSTSSSPTTSSTTNALKTLLLLRESHCSPTSSPTTSSVTSIPFAANYSTLVPTTATSESSRREELSQGPSIPKSRTIVDDLWIPDANAVIRQLQFYCQSRNPLKNRKLYLVNDMLSLFRMYNKGQRTLSLGRSYTINLQTLFPESLQDDHTTKITYPSIRALLLASFNNDHTTITESLNDDHTTNPKPIHRSLRNVKLFYDDSAHSDPQLFSAFTLGRLFLNDNPTFWIVFLRLNSQLYALRANDIDEEDIDPCANQRDVDVNDDETCTCTWKGNDVFGNDPGLLAVELGNLNVLKEALNNPLAELKWKPINGVQKWNSALVTK